MGSQAITRRAVLRVGLLGGASAAARALGGSAKLDAATQAIARFEQRLKVPRVLEPIARHTDQDVYDIVQREATQEILPGRLTTIWGYDGSFPGPTIRVRRNRPTVVRHTNQLKTHTVVHLHGGVIPALPQSRT